MTDASSNPPYSEWLAQSLSALLASPHIHFPKPPAGLPGLRLGPGPIDLFSTRFANLFSSDAKGSINGQVVDKAGLKEALLSIQKTWNVDTSRATAGIASDPKHIAAELCWTLDTNTRAEVKASATTIEEGGVPRINFLQLDGENYLLKSE